MARRPTGWDQPLTPTIVLTGGPGGGLRTLRHAADMLCNHFGSVTKDAALECALEHLLAAGEGDAPCKPARDQVAVMLRGRGWL